MRPKFAIPLLLAFSFTSSLANAATSIPEFMKTKEYKADKAMAALLIEYGSDIRFDSNTDSLSQHKLPFEQAAGIRLAKQWKDWQKDFCVKVESGKYHEFRGGDTNNTPGLLEEMKTLNDDFQYSQIRSYCSHMLKFTQQIVDDEKNTWFADRIPHSLATYKDNLTRAKGSNLYLSKIYSDTNGSSYKTLRQVKSTLETMISIHEIIADNKQSKKWRSELQDLNKSFEKIQNKSAGTIGEKFKRPRDSYTLSGGDAVRNKISSLVKKETGVKSAVILLADSEIHTTKSIADKTKGEKYSAIAFHALSTKKKTSILQYGWYQKDDDSGKETVTITSSEIFKGAGPGPKTSATAGADEIARQVESARAEAQGEADTAIADAQQGMVQHENLPPAGYRKGGVLLLLPFLTSLLMILSGLLIARKSILKLLPVSTQVPLNNGLDKVSAFVALIGFTLLALGFYGAVMSVVSFNPIGILFSIVTILAGLVLSANKILNFDPNDFKGKAAAAAKLKQKLEKHGSKLGLIKSQRLPIGIAAIVVGFYQLIF